jgi:putative transposase
MVEATPRGEPFLLSPKTEGTARNVCRTCDEARADAFDYLERYYSPRWRLSKLGNLSSQEFEARVMVA